MIKELIKSNINLLNTIARYINENKNVDGYLAEELWMISKDIIEYINLDIKLAHSDGDIFNNSDVLYSISAIHNLLIFTDEFEIDDELNTLLISYVFISKLILENDK